MHLFTQDLTVRPSHTEYRTPLHTVTHVYRFFAMHPNASSESPPLVKEFKKGYLASNQYPLIRLLTFNVHIPSENIHKSMKIVTTSHGNVVIETNEYQCLKIVA